MTYKSEVPGSFFTEVALKGCKSGSFRGTARKAFDDIFHNGKMNSPGMHCMAWENEMNSPDYTQIQSRELQRREVPNILQFCFTKRIMPVWKTFCSLKWSSIPHTFSVVHRKTGWLFYIWTSNFIRTGFHCSFLAFPSCLYYFGEPHYLYDIALSLYFRRTPSWPTITIGIEVIRIKINKEWLADPFVRP